jgi:predicted SAM-dependent methyltransferase
MVRFEFKNQRTHRASVRKSKIYRGQRRLRLNIGCGTNYKSGWINIDQFSKADLRLDLRENLPFENGSAAFIYCEHFFEHLRFPKEAYHFLRECHRVLEAGGKLDIGVPDSEWPIRSYSDETSEYFRLAREHFHPKWCNTKMHHLNFHFRQWDEHRYAYDEETLAAVLKKGNFVNVYRREFDRELDSEARSVGTLYMRSQKNRV